MTGGTLTGPRAYDDWTMGDWEHDLGREPTGAFRPDDVDGLPEPVRRYLLASITPGTPLATGVRLRMRGHIKVGRWLPFRARQVLDPHVGFVWSARAAGVIAGSDRYLDGVGEMHWKLAGLIDVASGRGPDVSTSAAGRCGMEAILVPTAMLPRSGVTWSVVGDEQIVAHHRVGATPVDVRLTIDNAGLVRFVLLRRWGDPDRTGTWGWHEFGGVITGHRPFDGLTIPSTGCLGWHAGTDRWAAGEFFRFEITELDVPVRGRLRAVSRAPLTPAARWSRVFPTTLALVPVPLFELVLPPRAAKAAGPTLAAVAVAGIALAAARAE